MTATPTTTSTATTSADLTWGEELPARVGTLDALRHAGTLAWRSVAQLRHNPDKLFDVTLMPVFFMVMFVYVFGGAVAGDTGAYLQQVVPGMMAMMVMFASQGLGITMNEDLTKGVFDRFRSFPIARSAPLVGASWPTWCASRWP